MHAYEAVSNGNLAAATTLWLSKCLCYPDSWNPTVDGESKLINLILFHHGEPALDDIFKECPRYWIILFRPHLVDVLITFRFHILISGKVTSLRIVPQVRTRRLNRPSFGKPPSSRKRSISINSRFALQLVWIETDTGVGI